MSRVYWLLTGPRQISSARIHGYRIHDYLRRRGWASEILYRPRRWQWDAPLTGSDLLECSVFQPGDVAVCQKLQGPRMVSALTALRSLQVKTVYLDCDWPVKLEEARLASEVACSSRYLAEEYARRGIAAVSWIPDAYEWEMERRRDHPASRLRGVWFGNSSRKRVAEVEELRQLIEGTRPGWTLMTVSGYATADVRWELRTAPRMIAGCDFAVIPGSEEAGGLAKSANRAIQAMALSLPVLAYPIPAYREVIRHGRNGFLCRTTEEWQSALRAIADLGTRRRVARCGYRYARRYFSMDRVGREWESLLGRLTGASRGAANSATGFEIPRPPAPDNLRIDAEWKAGLRKLRRQAAANGYR